MGVPARVSAVCPVNSTPPEPGDDDHSFLALPECARWAFHSSLCLFVCWFRGRARARQNPSPAITHLFGAGSKAANCLTNNSLLLLLEQQFSTTSLAHNSLITSEQTARNKDNPPPDRAGAWSSHARRRLCPCCCCESEPEIIMFARAFDLIRSER